MKRDIFQSSMKRCPQKKMLNWSSFENVLNKFSPKEKLWTKMYFMNQNYIRYIQLYYQLFSFKYAVFMWWIIIYVLMFYVTRSICNLNNLPIFFNQFHNFGTSWEWVIQQFTTVNFFFLLVHSYTFLEKCKEFYYMHIICILEIVST